MPTVVDELIVSLGLDASAFDAGQKKAAGDLLRMRVRPRSYDLVLCRNTVIYFTPDVRDDLHARLAESLRPGGVLLVGATERVADPAALGMRALRPHTYRREG